MQTEKGSCAIKPHYPNNGRAARNVDGRVILYADRITKSIDAAMQETQRRREIQLAYNLEHDIVPATVTKAISDLEMETKVAPTNDAGSEGVEALSAADEQDVSSAIESLKKRMKEHAKALDFESAATCRDQIRALERTFLGLD